MVVVRCIAIPRTSAAIDSHFGTGVFRPSFVGAASVSDEMLGRRASLRASVLSRVSAQHLHWHGEHIADAAFRPYQLLGLLIAANLASQPEDLDVDRPVVDLVAMQPR